MIDEDFYLGLATELIGKLRRLAFFTGHGLSIGIHHEEAVREAIRPLLSQRFSLRTGFAYAKKGVVSRQGDILIVDESDPSPYFYQLGNLAVVHPRAIAAVVEVKTNLDKESFLDSVKNLHTFKEVAREVDARRNFPTAVFAFEGTKLEIDTLHNWYEAVSLPHKLRSYPQFVYCLREGLLHLHFTQDRSDFGHFFLMGEEHDEIKSKGLSLVLQTIRKAVEVKAGLESNPFEYAVLEGMRYSKQFFKFGAGSFIYEDA